MSTKKKSSADEDTNLVTWLTADPDLRPLPDPGEDPLDTIARLEAEDEARRAEGEVRFVGKLLRSGGRDVRAITQQYEHLDGSWLLPYECYDLVDARERLHAEFPYATDVIDEILRPTFRNSGNGRPVVRIGPVLLVGDPGTGKSRLARRICEELGIGFRQASVAGALDSHILGVSRGWSSATASIVLEAVAATQRPNPVIILDEIEKPLRSHNGDLMSRLLPLLERSEAARWLEPLLGVEVDASHIGWIFTANSLNGLPDPLLSRVRVLHVPEPGAEHTGPLVRQILSDIAEDEGIDARWYAGAAPELTELLRPRLAEHRSVRVLRRQIEAALDALNERMPRV